MRADRLVSVLLLLQARGRVTAAEVADELEVSLATARRDLEALSTAGIPVYAQPGRAGGWSLVGGARTDLTGLTAGEAQALFLLLGPARGRSPAAASAFRKLARAMPATFRDDAVAAAEAVHVDRGAWGAAPTADPPEWLDAAQSAVVHRRRVELAYDGRDGRSVRTVDPWAVVDKDDVWYLVGGTQRGRRTFRIDRIHALTVLDERAVRPDDLDVAAVWDEVAATMEARRAAVRAVVLVDDRHLGVLRRLFGRHVVVQGTEADGRHRVEVGSHTARSVAEHLAGLADGFELVDAPDVGRELAAIGRTLVERHGAD